MTVTGPAVVNNDASTLTTSWVPVCDWIVTTTCTDRAYGARPLRRAIQRFIEDQLSEALIRGTIQAGGPIEVFMDGDKPGFRSAIGAASS